MSDSVYTVTVTHEVTDQLIRDIMITGCEGGIGYWPLLIAEQYESGGKGAWLRLGEAQIVYGIKRVLTDYPNGVTARNLVQALGDSDGSYLDSSDADNIIQCGLLGEIVYG